MKVSHIALAIAFLFQVSSANADAPNAAAVLKSCDRSPPVSAERDKCTSYINGVVTGVIVDQAARTQGTPICFPSTVTTEQVRQAVSAFINAHPAILTEDGNSVVGVALVEAFPCRGAQ